MANKENISLKELMLSSGYSEATAINPEKT